jgi:hypothetical protein
VAQHLHDTWGTVARRLYPAVDERVDEGERRWRKIGKQVALACERKVACTAVLTFKAEVTGWVVVGASGRCQGRTVSAVGAVASRRTAVGAATNMAWHIQSGAARSPWA